MIMIMNAVYMYLDLEGGCCGLLEGTILPLVRKEGNTTQPISQDSRQTDPTGNFRVRIYSFPG
jgi:hypothetical protein